MELSGCFTAMLALLASLDRSPANNLYIMNTRIAFTLTSNLFVQTVIYVVYRIIFPIVRYDHMTITVPYLNGGTLFTVQTCTKVLQTA